MSRAAGLRGAEAQSGLNARNVSGCVVQQAPGAWLLDLRASSAPNCDTDYDAISRLSPEAP